MRKILFFLMAFVFTSLTAFSDSDISNSKDSSPPENGVTHAIGAGGSVINTWGFTYRHHYKNRFGFSTNIGGWFNQYGGNIGNALGLMYTLSHPSFSKSKLPESSIRVYLVSYLANIFYSKDRYDDKESKTRVNELEIGIGAGPGVEYFFTPNFALHFEVAWMTFFKIESSKFSFHDSHLHPGGGFSFYF